MPQVNNVLKGLSLLIAFSLGGAYSMCAQGNYIKEYAPFTEVSPGMKLDMRNANITTTYYDYNGRPVQTVLHGITPKGHDMADYTEYDGLERKVKTWRAIPFTGSDGEFKCLEDFQTSQYVEDGCVSFAYNPSSIVAYMAETGVNSRGKSIVTVFPAEVPPAPMLNLTCDENHSVVRKGTRTAGLLFKKIVGEDGATLITAMDTEGRTILERRLEEREGNIDTYYIYDNLDRLVCVVPPGASAQMRRDGEYKLKNSDDHSDILGQFCYFYDYNEHGSCIAKKLPGADWVYIVYDGDQRPVLTQDGEQRKRHEWSFVKYDGLERPVLKGVVTIRTSFRDLVHRYSHKLVKEVWDVSATYGYTDRFPMGIGTRVHQVLFYDDYKFPSTFLEKSHASLVLNEAYLTAPKGLPTAIYTASLDSTGHYEAKIMYYDHRCRMVESTGYNSLSHILRHEKFTYDFLGHILSDAINCESLNETCDLTLNKAYDSAGREIKSDCRICYTGKGYSCTKEYPLRTVAYDEFCRPEKLGTFHLVTNIKHGVDGKLQGISNDVFSETLHYDEPAPNVLGYQSFSGKITSTDITQGDRRYSFAHCYDILGRYTHGMSEEINLEEEFYYDNMGNTTWRSFASPEGDVNLLQLQYQGNHLFYIKENRHDRWPPYRYYNLAYKDAPAYEFFGYDANGNETRNLSRSMTYAHYNNINLPDSIVMENNDMLLLQYLSDGRRIRTTCKRHTTPVGIPMDNSVSASDPQVFFDEIRDDNIVMLNGRMSRIDFDGGYFSLVNDTTGASELRAYYYVTDHLGSVRAVCDGESGAVVKRMEYMPSGLVFSKMWYDNNRHPRYFCGKEELPMEELRLYDSYARLQDTHIPRFTTMDPLCEQYYSMSPYAYCENNPISKIDTDGQWSWDINGNLISDKDDNEKTLANFLNTTLYNAEVLLSTHRLISENKDKNLEKGVTLNKENLWIMEADLMGEVVNNTKEALYHYYFGDGVPADVGDESTNELLNSERFKQNLKVITTEKRTENSFSVDLTRKTFHIGRTPVKYKVNSGERASCVIFTLFDGDGFWDPLDVGFEAGGTPYYYKSRKITYFFKPIK